jgi:hypothetical protein
MMQRLGERFGREAGDVIDRSTALLGQASSLASHLRPGIRSLAFKMVWQRVNTLFLPSADLLVGNWAIKEWTSLHC